jgi:hypothetical protein
MRIRLVLALGFACLAGISVAHAVDEDAAFARLKALIAPGETSALCLARSYGAEHLKAHPKQQVTKLVLSMRYVPLSEDDAILESRDDGGTDKRYFRYDFTLAANVRVEKHTLYAGGDCSSAQGIGCGVDCDGGGFDIEPIAGDKGSILMRLEREHGGFIRMTIGCDGGDHEYNLRAGEDDKVFKLDKAPTSVCETMQADYDKLVQ